MSDRLKSNIKSYKYLKYTAFAALFKKKKRVNFFKRCVLKVPFLRALIKKSLLFEIPFNEKTQYLCVKTLQLEKTSERFRRRFRLVVFPKINDKKFEVEKW